MNSKHQPDLSQPTVVDELATAIDRLPIDNLLAGADILDLPDIAGTESEVLSRLAELFTTAKLGGPSAIESIRRIGNCASEMLESIAAGKDEIDTTPAYPKPNLPGDSHYYNHSSRHAHIISRGALDDVMEILTSRRDAIRKDFESGNDQTYRRDKLYSMDIEFDIGEICFNENFEARLLNSIYDPALRQRREFEWNSMSSSERLDYLADATTSLSDNPLPHQRAASAVTDLINSLVGNRLANAHRIEAQRALLSISRASLSWPARLSAIPYLTGRAGELRDFLSLGSSFPFRLERERGEPGNRPQIDPESAAGFALGVLIPIYEEWQRAATFTIDQIESLKSAAREFQGLVKKSARPKSTVSFDSTREIHVGAITLRITLRERWRLMAILLPQFPSVIQSEEETYRFERWRKVAIERAEWICDGNWADYEWPRCVKRSVNLTDRQKQLRTHQEEVAARLREGLRVLRSKSQS